MMTWVKTPLIDQAPLDCEYIRDLDPSAPRKPQ